MSRTLLLALAPLIALIAFGAWFAFREPPHQLDLLDRYWSGAAGVPVATGIDYAPDGGHRLDIYAPADRAANAPPLPVLMFIYGGGWHSGSRDHYGFAGRAFAARGFLTVVIDYRLVPEGRFPAMLQDSAAALAWVHGNIARYGGNPSRLLVAGHSAGAYNSLMLALDPQWAAAAGLPAGTIVGAASLAGPADFHPFTTDSGRDAFGHVTDPRTTQPIHFASADAPPIWLGHGTADTVVRPYNSQRLAAALTDVGSTVTLREYPGMDHSDIIMAIARPFRNKGPVLDDAAAFLHRAYRQ